MKSLVIVESGAKAKKIKGYLDSNFPDKDWQVEACVGHVRDLADNENAVDPSDWNKLKWEFSSKGKKVMRDLRRKFPFKFVPIARIDSIFIICKISYMTYACFNLPILIRKVRVQVAFYFFCFCTRFDNY
jgi:hypothetical protein